MRDDMERGTCGQGPELTFTNRSSISPSSSCCTGGGGDFRLVGTPVLPLPVDSNMLPLRRRSIPLALEEALDSGDRSIANALGTQHILAAGNIHMDMLDAKLSTAESRYVARQHSRFAAHALPYSAMALRAAVCFSWGFQRI